MTQAWHASAVRFVAAAATGMALGYVSSLLAEDLFG